MEPTKRIRGMSHEVYNPVFDVVTIINHPPVITIDRWYKPSNIGWFMTLF